ncbi:MAG TPA: polysaccharide biosynthesis/export family protein, partial [Gemmatimonadales bacterium]|nr:polysaccharide biosynthesis/export family protein [Gemmatimonadales bacterium]
MFAAAAGFGFQDGLQQPPENAGRDPRSTYVLGRDDVITIRVTDAEEIGDQPVRIDPSGYIDLPMVGRLRAAGLTVEQLKAELVSRLKAYLNQPEVTVSIAEAHSQPVSVIGSVNNPGVIQLQGSKTLVEMLALAGGLRPDAGHSAKITRKREWGPVPLPGAAADATGNFSIGEVSLKAVMEARNPEQNILIRPEDVITVPRADIVYVLGAVPKPGGFVLNDQENISVLQVLSLAGGLERAAAAKNAKILRPAPGAAKRTEIAVDLKRLFAGEGVDELLKPDDIL